MATVSFGSFSKRRNSTKQPATLSDQRTVTLKESCSQDRPVFICTGNNFNYNYCMWDSKYYFIDEIVSLKNNLIEIHCVMDPLATYKSYIIASTQFVSYSSQLGSSWLVDTRIPVLKKGNGKKVQVINPYFSRSGTYILSVNGENGCELYQLSLSDIKQLLSNESQWQSDAETAFLDNLVAPGGDIVQAVENAYKVIARAGAFGNAYSEAPSCIRSCIWVPFSSSAFTVIANREIYLGQFPTSVWANAISAAPTTDSFTVSIPWEYNDWRRCVCEDLYMYLPLVGLVSIVADNIANNSSITIDYSLSPTDGCVAYELSSGNQIIGSYGGSCSANFPIGISQQASSGEIINSILAGGENIVSAAIHSTISPVSMGAVPVAAMYEGAVAAYNTVNVANSRHNVTIGGVGGGVGAGLDLQITLFDVVHDTVVAPSAMQATMGLPTMKPMSLSSLTGYCQCSNAHVDAPATAGELDAIDAYLNSGFFIE